jgi:PAP2 superfamily C-terminal
MPHTKRVTETPQKLHDPRIIDHGLISSNGGMENSQGNVLNKSVSIVYEVIASPVPVPTSSGITSLIDSDSMTRSRSRSVNERPSDEVGFTAFFSDKRWSFLFTYQNLKLSFLSLLYWVLCMSFHSYTSRSTYTRGVVHFNMVGTPPLRDLLHEFLPNMQQFRIVPEIGHVIPVLYLLGLLLYHFDQRSLDTFRLFLYIHGTLMVIRALSFAVTILPDSSQQCHTSLFLGGCHDLIFSGHVMITLLSSLLAQKFFHIPLFMLIFMVFNVVFVSFMVVVVRNHYTVDVLIAITTTLFFYMAFTKRPTLLSFALSNPNKIRALGTWKHRCYQAYLRTLNPDQNKPFVGNDGYDIIREKELLEEIIHHSTNVLELMGLRPKVVMKHTTTPSSSNKHSKNPVRKSSFSHYRRGSSFDVAPSSSHSTPVNVAPYQVVRNRRLNKLFGTYFRSRSSSASSSSSGYMEEDAAQSTSSGDQIPITHSSTQTGSANQVPKDLRDFQSASTIHTPSVSSIPVSPQLSVQTSELSYKEADTIVSSISLYEFK